VAARTGLSFNDVVGNALQTSRKDASGGELRSNLTSADLRRASLAVESSSNDQSVRRAGEQFREGLDRIEAARSVERASLSGTLESKNSADNRVGNAVSLSRDDAASIQAAARANGMTDGEIRTAGAAPNSAEGKRLQAIAEQYYATRTADAGAGGQLMGQAPVAPMSQGDVAATGAQLRDGVTKSGNNAVDGAAVRNKAEVQSALPLSPRSEPANWGAVVMQAAEQVQGAADQVSNRANDAQYMATGSMLSDYLNRDQTSGSGAPFKLLGQNSPFAQQLGFRAPEEALQAVDRVYSSGTDTDRAQILSLGQDLQRGNASPERVRDTLQYVEARDEQLSKAQRQDPQGRRTRDEPQLEFVPG